MSIPNKKEAKGNRCLENRERRLKGGPEFAFWEEWEAKPQSSFKEVDMIKFAFLERPFSPLCREGLEGVKIGFSLEKALQEFRQVMMIA